eukprot:scaffold2908_cov105-Isochrysis_galbana.AAC.12
MAPSNECVRVVVRCRPLNSTERNDNRGVIVDMNKATGTVILSAGSKATNEPPKIFTFDAVFPPDTHQVWLHRGEREFIACEQSVPVSHRTASGLVTARARRS